MGARPKGRSRLAQADRQLAGFYTKGDVKIGGLPATVEYARLPATRMRRSASMQRSTMPGARVSASAWARHCRGGSVEGPRRVAANERESRYQVEADLKDSKITELLRGGGKPPGKPPA